MNPNPPAPCRMGFLTWKTAFVALVPATLLAQRARSVTRTRLWLSAPADRTSTPQPAPHHCPGSSSELWMRYDLRLKRLNFYRYDIVSACRISYIASYMTTSSCIRDDCYHCTVPHILAHAYTNKIINSL